jgi:hypothetical protein
VACVKTSDKGFGVLLISFDFMLIYCRHEFVVVKPSMESYFSFHIHCSQKYVLHKIIHLNEKYTSRQIPFVYVICLLKDDLV